MKNVVPITARAESILTVTIAPRASESFTFPVVMLKSARTVKAN
jgi:hypothetical protein